MDKEQLIELELKSNILKKRNSSIFNSWRAKVHTKDNVIPACYICNTTRNNSFSVEEMLLIGSVIKTIKQNRKNNDRNF